MGSEAILSQIESQDSLIEVNTILTNCMANQSIQGVIKGDNLHRILDVIIDFATEDTNPLSELRLKAAASLGRLAAVARSRQNEVYQYLPQLFEDEPCDFDMLIDGDEKHYAAQSISHIQDDWVVDYCLRQAVLTDTAENARRTLIQNALIKCANLSDLLQLGQESFTYLSIIDSVETRMKRARRITRAWNEIVKDWNGDVGSDVGKVLARWLHSILMHSSPSVESSVMIDIVDDALAILIRTIELRFSNALLADTYQVLEVSRNVLSSSLWGEVNRESEFLPRIKTNLKEAALVLARQNRTDVNIMKQLSKAYYSKAQVIPALKHHFMSSQELDPQIKEWWLNGGKQMVSAQEPVHTLGNSEDQQIGSLLIQVETSQNTMEKLERAVVPFLEISDPPLASTVKKASSGFGDMARIARQLARMRKLTHTDSLGQILEYNPMQHEMLGGHKYGIRKIRVVRDGIQKEFGGKIKTLVKPWVEAVENQDEE